MNGIGAGGLYYPGLDFAVTRKSGTILAAAEEASTMVAHICERLGRTLVTDPESTQALRTLPVRLVPTSVASSA